MSKGTDIFSFNITIRLPLRTLNDYVKLQDENFPMSTPTPSLVSFSILPFGQVKDGQLEVVKHGPGPSFLSFPG